MPKRRVSDPDNPPSRLRTSHRCGRRSSHASCGRRGVSTIPWPTEDPDEAADQSPDRSGRARGLPRHGKGMASADECHARGPCASPCEGCALDGNAARAARVMMNRDDRPLATKSPRNCRPA
jgi:hypothetical protein